MRGNCGGRMTYHFVTTLLGGDMTALLYNSTLFINNKSSDASQPFFLFLFCFKEVMMCNYEYDEATRLSMWEGTWTRRPNKRRTKYLLTHYYYYYRQFLNTPKGERERVF